MFKSQEFSKCHEALSQEQKKWEIPNLQIIRYIKRSIPAVAYLVTGLE